MKCYFGLILTCCLSLSLNGQISNQKIGNPYSKADSVAGLYPRYSLNNLELLSKLLTNGLSKEEDKFRSIFKWVCDNIENDYYLFDINNRKRLKFKDKPSKLSRWNLKYRKKVFNTLNKEYKTMCTGYAYLIKELSMHAGIECAIINGYGRTYSSNIGGSGFANHSWNAVKINDQWFLSDATWSSGFIRSDIKEFVADKRATYFLVKPELFWRNHYPIESKWLLMDKEPRLRRFLDGPLLYRKSFEVEVVPSAPESFYIGCKKNDPICIVLKELGSYEIQEIEVQLVNRNKVKTLKPKISHNSSFAKLNVTIPYSGKFELHLYIEGDPIISYEVTSN